MLLQDMGNFEVYWQPLPWLDRPKLEDQSLACLQLTALSLSAGGAEGFKGQDEPVQKQPVCPDDAFRGRQE